MLKRATRLLDFSVCGGMSNLKAEKEDDEVLELKLPMCLQNFNSSLSEHNVQSWNPSKLCGVEASYFASPPFSSPHTRLSFPFPFPPSPELMLWLILGVSSVCSILSKEPDFRHQSQSSSRWVHTNAHVLPLWNDILGAMVRVCCVISWNRLDFPSSPCFPLRTLFNCLSWSGPIYIFCFISPQSGSSTEPLAFTMMQRPKI